MTDVGCWCEKTFGYRFRDTEHLERALTHRSAAGQNNERLEYLGDAALGLIIAEALFEKLPGANEGDLSRLRASLVKGRTLGEIALQVDLGSWLRLGSGELKSGGHRRESILANALEAVIGAAYLDGGLDAARGLVLRLYQGRLDNLPKAEELKDAKTRLQEVLQARGMALPRYSMESRGGEDHAQTFVVSCTLSENNMTSSGAGGTRRHAEQEAAGRMINALKKMWDASNRNE
ncbi:MAG: ribonuclease III [Gammaproteobacteria bacterium]